MSLYSQYRELTAIRASDEFWGSQQLPIQVCPEIFVAPVSETATSTFWYNCSMTSRFFSKDNLSFTYQTRIRGNEDALSAYAKLFGVLQRRLFADVCSGNPTASLKSLHPQVWHTRKGVQRHQGDPRRQDVGSSESQKLHRQTLEGLIGALRSNTSLLSEERRPRSFTRSEGARQSEASHEVFRLTLIREGSGCALDRRSCGAVSTILRPMATGVTPNGLLTGKRRAATSSSLLAAGMRPRAASCAWQL